MKMSESLYASFTLHVAGTLIPTRNFMWAIFKQFLRVAHRKVHRELLLFFLGDNLHMIFKGVFCWDCCVIQSHNSPGKITPCLGCHLEWMAPKHALCVLQWFLLDLELLAESCRIDQSVNGALWLLEAWPSHFQKRWHFVSPIISSILSSTKR